MKLKMILVLCVMGMAHCLMGMEQQKNDGYLVFICDMNRLIEKSYKHNMQYFLQPKDFYGKKITEVISLSEYDQKQVEKSFFEALEKKQKQAVTYTLLNQEFIAKIKMIQADDNKDCFYVKVREVNK